MDPQQIVPECVYCGAKSKATLLATQLYFLDQHILVCPRRFQCSICEERFQSIIKTIEHESKCLSTLRNKCNVSLSVVNEVEDDDACIELWEGDSGGPYIYVEDLVQREGPVKLLFKLSKPSSEATL